MASGDDKPQRRLKFYGLDDYGSYFQIERLTEILEQFDVTRTSYGVTDVIELRNAQLYAENNLFPPSYTEEQRAAAQTLLPEIRKTVATFFNRVADTTIATTVVDVEREYHADLLDLLAQFKIFDRCSANIVLPVLDANGIFTGELLTCKAIVKAYDADIRTRLLSDPNNAEHLIRKYLEKDPRHPAHLPASFSPADARTLLDAYLDSHDANPNFVHLVARARVTKEAGIDAKLKLKAKRRYDRWTDEFFKENDGIKTGCEVSISPTQTEPAEASLEDMVAKLSYSQQWLEENLDNPTILNNFIYLFEFANSHMLLTLPSFYADLGVFERFLTTTGKNDYPLGAAFNLKTQSSLLQTMMYDRFLRSKDVELESVLAWFFADYLQAEFGAANLKFAPSSKAATYLEKSRHLFSEMESVIKQFSLYAENGELDPELLAMSSDQVRYAEIPSLMPDKYVYLAEQQDIRRIQHLLFSDQSALSYINEDLNDTNAAQLLIQHAVTYQDFADHQKHDLDFLINQGVLENTGQRVHFASARQLRVLKVLFDYEAGSYYHYPAEVRDVVDAMVAKGWLVRRGLLLTKPEASYFNYYLNHAEFSNGPDLRNKYLHGSQAEADNEQAHFLTYITALKMLIALVIKINDEFSLRELEQSRSADPN